MSRSIRSIRSIRSSDAALDKSLVPKRQPFLSIGSHRWMAMKMRCSGSCGTEGAGLRGGGEGAGAGGGVATLPLAQTTLSHSPEHQTPALLLRFATRCASPPIPPDNWSELILKIIISSKICYQKCLNQFYEMRIDSLTDTDYCSSPLKIETDTRQIWVEWSLIIPSKRSVWSTINDQCNGSVLLQRSTSGVSLPVDVDDSWLFSTLLTGQNWGQNWGQYIGMTNSWPINITYIVDHPQAQGISQPRWIVQLSTMSESHMNIEQCQL